MSSVAGKIKPTFDVQKIRKDFPILERFIGKNKLVYLDNAATAQKPNQVIDAVQDYYKGYNANVHRGVHTLSQDATNELEKARESARKFIGAASDKEIVFVRNATEGINLVASTWGRKFIKEGDEILITEMEHHANIVPWQMLCEEKKASLKVLPLLKNGELDLSQLPELLTKQTKLFAFPYVSNVLGTINPAKEMIQMAKKLGVTTMVDGAQASPHRSVNVVDLDCDFYVFSGHKIFAPSGTGVLYGKKAILDETPPYQGGGSMISEVTFPKTTYNTTPFKFEAGTPNIEGGIGMGAAMEYLMSIGMDAIESYEHTLLQYANQELKKMEGLEIYGTSSNKAAVIAFNLKGIHHQDVGILLDQQGIAIRTGHHCCQPIMRFFDVSGMCRASFAFYNTKEEVDKLIEGIKKAKTILS